MHEKSYTHKENIIVLHTGCHSSPKENTTHLLTLERFGVQGLGVGLGFRAQGFRA